MQKVIVIVGPTASGKSALAVYLSKRLNGEVISADSRQVYKGLNIGTGKITKREMRGIRHHLLDVASTKKIFTASDFVRLGTNAISDIQSRGKTVVICGGTGFYIDALLGRITLADVAPNKKLREKLQKKTATQLFEMLQKADPKRAKTIDRHNPVRLIRALEITAQQSHQKFQGVALKSRRRLEIESRRRLEIDPVWVGIMPDKKILRSRIHARLLQRMKIGMVQEAKKLHTSGLSYKRMQELGLEYRYLAHYLQMKISKKEMFDQLDVRIWQYAKRQMTYWRKNKDIRWFESAEEAYANVMAGPQGFEP